MNLLYVHHSIMNILFAFIKERRLDTEKSSPIFIERELGITLLDQILKQTEIKTEVVDNSQLIASSSPPVRIQQQEEVMKIGIREEVRAIIQQMLEQLKADPTLHLAFVDIERHNLTQPQFLKQTNSPTTLGNPILTAVIPPSITFDFELNTTAHLIDLFNEIKIKNLVNPWSIVLYKDLWS